MNPSGLKISHAIAGVLIGCCVGTAGVANAAAIKRVHGGACAPVNGGSHAYVNRGYQITGGSSAICPVVTTQDLELDDIYNAKVNIYFDQSNSCSSSTIKACFADTSGGSTFCSSTWVSTNTDCGASGNPHEYSFTKAGLSTNLDAWVAGNSGDYAYIVVNGGSSTDLTIMGYKVYDSTY